MRMVVSRKAARSTLCRPALFLPLFLKSSQRLTEALTVSSTFFTLFTLSRPFPPAHCSPSALQDWRWDSESCSGFFFFFRGFSLGSLRVADLIKRCMLPLDEIIANGVVGRNR